MRDRERILCPCCNLEYLELEREHSKNKCLICIDHERHNQENYKRAENMRMEKLIGKKYTKE